MWPLRPIMAIAVIIFIFFISGVYEIYVRLHGQHSIYRISPTLKWVGVIDTDYDHGIDIGGVVKGADVILAVDYNNPLFQQYYQDLIRKNPRIGAYGFEIGEMDSNGDGLIDASDMIYPFLHIIYFKPNGEGYEIRSLIHGGIRAINIKHLTPYGNHRVIMSDGSIRTLYEIDRPGGTAVHKTKEGTVITDLPEKSAQ